MEGDTDDMRGQTLPSSWDAAPAQRFFVHIVSFILYARGSFPADCFRRISYEQWEAPDSTHDTLLESGDSMTFSMDSRDYIPAQSGPFIYPRRSKNVRLDGFLNSLEGTLAAIQQQRLGRYRICFSRSKAQDPDALVESYDLEFCYTEEGSLFVDVKWKGVNDTIIPKGCKDPFNTFFKTRSPITGTFYTHPFMYFNDGKPLDHEVDHNLENFLKQAVPLLKQKPHSGSGRIDTLVLVFSGDYLWEKASPADHAT